MLRKLKHNARNGQPLWLPDVRAAFAASDGTPVILRLKSFDGAARDWTCRLPHWEGDEERALVRDYLCATVYNAMSVCGGYEMTVFLDPHAEDAMGLVAELPEAFQLSRRDRRGLGKVVNIAGRMGRMFGKPEFSFVVSDIRDHRPLPRSENSGSPNLAETLRALCDSAAGINIVGVDVGGTDIKLAASRGGKLAAVKEYDWNPAAYRTVEEIIAPILLLIRLMRACMASDREDAALQRALRKDAPLAEIEAAVLQAESRCNADVLDAVGVSFPDVVLHDRIIGGETPKTDGVRRNGAVDYEAELSQLAGLKQRILALCRGEGRCRIVNDGNMAAFTAAMEYACGGDPRTIERGVIAHSLGTDLGTGWLCADGAVPQMPLELYDTWVDLGSAPYAAFPPDDLRSTRNANSGLPGARRYLGQAAAYRLAWIQDPSLLDGFTEESDGVLQIRVAPEDLRKPCLEHLMRKAAEGNKAAEEVFRQIGRNLAMVSLELEERLHSGTDRRLLFGRFVKSERCFALMREGFSEHMPQVRLENGGEDLANTPLMRELAERKDVTVAQFAQAVGAVYYAMEDTP